ncbi:hypothetical protein FRC00_007772 [Tulasnella sp. 408]|nr:hypothetical protein FRC00_007772 [Tulasnella sp. 408]
MASAKHILMALGAHPNLEDLKIHQVQHFLELGTRLLPEILGSVNATAHSSSPPALAPKFQEFLSFSLNLTLEQVGVCWETLYPILTRAESPNDFSANFDDSAFLEHSIAAHSLMVQADTCQQMSCDAKLVHKPAIHSIAFTLRRGALPIFCPSLYCTRCLTRYYYNYSVTEASNSKSQRIYYGGIPQWIEVSDHIFVDIEFCEWIEKEMAFAQ